jgi:hypothetical protein
MRAQKSALDLREARVGSERVRLAPFHPRRLPSYRSLVPRQQKWADEVHAPLTEQVLTAVRHSNEPGRPYGDEAGRRRHVKKLDLDRVIRPRGRPRKVVGGKRSSAPLILNSFSLDKRSWLLLRECLKLRRPPYWR